jgi:hypothetical protein
MPGGGLASVRAVDCAGTDPDDLPAIPEFGVINAIDPPTVASRITVTARFPRAIATP